MALTPEQQKELDELRGEVFGESASVLTATPAIGQPVAPSPKQTPIHAPGRTTAEDAELLQLKTDLGLIETPEEEEKELSIGERAGAAAETTAAIASSIVAEPIAGLAGIAVTGTTALTNLLGFTDRDIGSAGADAVKSARDALTFEPRLDAAKENLASVGEFLEPVGNALSTAETILGDAGFAAGQALGLSDGAAAILGAAGKTIPTALIELLGLGISKAATLLLRGPKGSLAAAMPQVEDLRASSAALFKEVKEADEMVSSHNFLKLTDDIETAAKEMGASTLTTKPAFAVIDEFRKVVQRNTPVEVNELLQLRTVAQQAAKTIDPAQKAPLIAIIDEVDFFITKRMEDISPKLDQARKLWGRARRGELIEEAIKDAENSASGFENGLRKEFEKIVKNKRQIKFFDPKERAAMRALIKGTKSANLTKFIGKAGFLEGRAGNPIAILGAIAGGITAVGTGGAAPALLALGIGTTGQASKIIAQRLTRGAARGVEKTIKAGSKADSLVKTYFATTPRAERSIEGLRKILIEDKARNLKEFRALFAREAADSALGISGGVAGVGVNTLTEEERRKEKTRKLSLDN